MRAFGACLRWRRRLRFRFLLVRIGVVLNVDIKIFFLRVPELALRWNRRRLDVHKYTSTLTTTSPLASYLAIAVS